MKTIAVLLLLIVISLFAVRAFFTPSYIPTHDAEYHVVRLWQFDKNMKDGNLVPVWAPDLNYGYGVPIFAFFYPLPNYIGQVFHMLQFSFIDSVKLVLATSMIFSAVFFFLWLKCFFSNWASFVGAISFILAPYHLVVVSIRGSVGEAWALVFFPLTLFLITKTTILKHPRFYTAGSLGIVLSALMLSHNVLGSIFFTCAVAYTIVVAFHCKKSWALLVVGYTLSFLLVSFFYVPIVLERHYVTGLEIVNFKDHFVSFFQLILPSWGSGFSVPGISDQLSFQVGVAHILSFLVAAIIAIRTKNWLVIAMLIAGSLIVFLMLEESVAIWEWFTILRFMQFPWRLLSVIVVVASFMVGYVTMNNRLLGLLLLVLCLFYIPYTNTVRYEPREDSYLLSNNNWTDGTTTVGNSFNTQWFNLPKAHSDEFYQSSSPGQISSITRTSTSSQATIELESESTVELHRAYFPGWKGYIDGKPAMIVNNPNGIVGIHVPVGIHSILVRFEGTVARTVSLWISTVALVGTLYFSIVSLYENRDKHISA